MEFTTADRESTLWKKLKAHFEERRAFLRQCNDNKMSEMDRNFLIGQIAEIKAFLALEKPGIVVPTISQG